MSAVEITISGVLYDKYDRTSKPVVLIGEAFLTGLEVGGGPIIPPPQDKPPTIWGPGDPRPNPPIAFPPGWIGGIPPILQPPVDPPIDIPPDVPPTTIVKPPPENGGWGWSPAYGWGYFPGSGGVGPKK